MQMYPFQQLHSAVNRRKQRGTTNCHQTRCHRFAGSKANVHLVTRPEIAKYLIEPSSVILGQSGVQVEFRWFREGSERKFHSRTFATSFEHMQHQERTVILSILQEHVSSFVAMSDDTFKPESEHFASGRFFAMALPPTLSSRSIDARCVTKATDSLALMLRRRLKRSPVSVRCAAVET